MYLNKPFYRKSSDGYFFLYKPEFEQDLNNPTFSPYTSVSGLPSVIGQYKTEEELQVKSLEFFGEKAVDATVK